MGCITDTCDVLLQACRLVAHAAEVKEQESASAPTQSGADEYYEVEPTPRACHGL